MRANRFWFPISFFDPSTINEDDCSAILWGAQPLTRLPITLKP